jgi:hypothetical protein
MRRNRRRLNRLLPSVIVVLLCLAAPAWGLDEDEQAWVLVTARGSIHGRWKLYLEAQPRFDETGTRQLLLRPAVGYQVTPQWSLWQGYGWTPSFDDFRDEQRSFQQSLVETPRGFLPVTLVNRTRLEQRWIEDSDGTAWRLRHMLRLVYPLDDDGTWALAAYDEPFVALNSVSDGPRSGFDQNRAFAGINRALGYGFRLELGYLNQFVNQRGGQSDLVRHVGLVWLDYVW